MTQLKYQDRVIQTREGETVLDACLRQGVNLPFSCRNGVCHACMQQCIQGEIPPEAQHGLNADLSAQGCFLTCLCVPSGPMTMGPPSGLFAKTLVDSKDLLSADVCRLLLEPPVSLVCLPGQFLNLRRADGVVRSYSVANVPEEDYFIELHVQRMAGGEMSNWILDELQAGDEIEIQGANGDCYYREAAASQPMLLIGTGTGASPLLAIVRDALRHQHGAQIHLYHGALANERFYLREALRKLQQQHAQFHYHECILQDAAPQPGVMVGDVLQVATAQHPDLSGWQVFLAGAPELVARGEQLALQCGAVPASIHTDSFALRELRTMPREGGTKTSDETAEARSYPQPDPELWAALDQGDRLMAVLRDFYGRVFEDQRLSSFFHGTTRQRSIEKQFLFMRQLITGEKIYFGDRPRNSHHWMVISDELFDYRGELMMSCLREHGVPEDMVQRFHQMEEYFRSDIVKAKPFPRVMGDVELPLDGFEDLVMDVGSLCDTCEREVQAGETVKYHLRLGKIYCTDCSEQNHHEASVG